MERDVSRNEINSRRSGILVLKPCWYSYGKRGGNQACSLIFERKVIENSALQEIFKKLK